MKRRADSAKSVSEISRKSLCTESETETDGDCKNDFLSPSGVKNLSISSDDPPSTDLQKNGDPTKSHPNGVPSNEKKMDQEIVEKVALLDFGAQYGMVIDRRVRELSIYSETFPLTITAKELAEKKFSCIVISGGPNSVYAENAPKYDPEIFNLGIPILGICYGFQLINKHFGGTVSRSKFREDGQINIKIETDCPLFSGLNEQERVLLTHGDSVLPSTVAPDFRIIASAKNVVAGISNESKKIYGLQFHPEVDLTVNGVAIFENFLRKIVNLSATYTFHNREQLCLDGIREIVGEKKVLVMVSGGVDSTVCAALLHKALDPGRVIAVHIDNGFMRQDESKNVDKALNAIGLNVKSFTCVDDFLDARLSLEKMETPPLREVIDPEHKRLIIGDTFIRCKDAISHKLGLDTDMFFAQGTLRPDLIESASSLASGCADTIKTHHNDTALVRKLRDLGKVIEPLKDFHKDEVRQLGRDLGLPETIVNRHPFPGPGLAIRIICADHPYANDSFDEVAKQVSELTDKFCEKYKFDFKVYSTLLPIRTVGVQGDCRSYSYAVALSTDHRPVPWKQLDFIADYIPTVIPQVNRVCFAFGPAIKHSIRDITITRLSEGIINKLRRADDIVTQVLNGMDAESNLLQDIKPTMHLIQQMPVVLIPIQFNKLDAVATVRGTFIHSIVLRPFCTRDFMVGKNGLPERDIPEATIQLIVNRILSEVPFISRVLIDLTSKPPGTTEWE